MIFTRSVLAVLSATLVAAGCDEGTTLGGDGAQDVDGAPEDGTAEDTAPDDAVTGDADGSDTAGDIEDAVDADGADAWPANCPGYVPPYSYPPADGEPCRDDGDCLTSMTYCFLPGVTVCPMCPTMPHECTGDDECAGGLCVVVPRPCDYCPEDGTRCVPRCTPDGCGETARCNATTGRCDPIPCDDGYDCPDNFRCTGTGDGHGCSRLTCSTDAVCDCGVCIGGACLDGPGVCSGPAA